MREIARWADIPVINLQCDVDHPTQTLADLMTLREKRGENLRGLRVAMSWAYAPSYARPLSVPQGIATLLPRFGMDVVLAHPPGFELMPEVMERAEAAAAEAGATISYTDDMDEAFRGADVVYPKSWGRLDAFTRRVQGTRGVRCVQRLDLRRAPDDAGEHPTRSTCTACRRTAATR